jgi:Bacterial virulence factor lipase N-terminal
MLPSTLRKLAFDPRFPPARRSRRAPSGERPPTCKPCLELLEDRLPPGDLLLGGMLGSALCGPSLSAADPESWTPEGTSAGSLASALGGAGQSQWTTTTSGSLAAEFVLTTADHLAEQPRREGGEAGSVTALMLAGGGGDVPGDSAPNWFDVDYPFASALTDPLQGSAALRRGGVATSPEPIVGPAQGGGEAAGSGAAPAPNVAVGTSAGVPGVAQPVAPAEGASSSLAALSSDAELPGALPQPGASAEGSPGASSAAAAARHQGPAVHATFDLSAPAGAAFPSNRFAVDDANNLTGLRVNLPLPNASNPSDPIDQDTQVLNTLDGFNLQPRLSIPFDGPIDVNSVNSQDVFLINLGDTVDHQEHGAHIVGINQVVWDPATNTLHAESDQLLDQHTRYALIVTNGVRDADGQPVQASEDFTHFRHDLNFGQTKDLGLKEYRKELLDASAAAAQVGVPERAIVTASVFTTESATAVLENIRDQIDAATPDPANFYLPRPDGTTTTTPTVFSFNQVSGITLTQQIGWTTQPGNDQPVPVFGGNGSGPLNLSLLKLYPGAVGEIAFGSYQSPDYEVHPGEYIPPVDTRTGNPVVHGTNKIYFDLVLPPGQPPAGSDGWPVAIYGHGGGSNKDRSMTLVAASMAAHGIATIIINDVGNGLGRDGTLTVTTQQPNGTLTSTRFLAGGRGIDQDSDGTIDAQEGLSATLAPNPDPNAVQDWSLITARDGIQQTVVDLMQLVRVIEVGMDVPSAVDGVSSSHLDPTHISYFGWSQGANIGAPFLAVEPDVRAGVITNPGYGYINEAARLSPVNRPSSGNANGKALAAHVPSLINAPGISSIDGVPVSVPATGSFYFNENMPLRDGIPLTVGLADGTTHKIPSPVTNTVAGAMAIQEFFDNGEWAAQAGSPVAYAPHLRKDPLAGMAAKSVIVQFAYGDQTAANPNVWALIRAGDLAEQATFYRHDLAFADNSKLNKDPHRFLVATDVLAFRPIALAAQAQIAAFFASDGTVVIQPPGVPAVYFEVPIDLPLLKEERINLENLNFIT